MVRSQLKRMQGLSLVELAVSMAILSLLLAAILPVMTSGIGAGGKSEDSPTLSISESRLLLEEIDDAILGFLHTHYRLPCPDINLDGREDCTVSSGITVNPAEHGVSDEGKVHVGYLPVADLQIALNADEEWRRVSIEYGVYRQQQDSKDLAIQGNHFNQVPVNHEPLCEEGKSDCAVNRYRVANSSTSLYSGYLGRSFNKTSDSDGLKQSDGYQTTTNTINTLDFCQQLTGLERGNEISDVLSAKKNQRLFTERIKAENGTAGVIYPAYTLSISRSQKVLTGEGYSERNTNDVFEFQAESRTATSEYDDTTLIKSFAQLNRELNCGKRLSQANTSLFKGIAHIANENMYQLHLANSEIYMLNTAEGIARLELGEIFLNLDKLFNIAAIKDATDDMISSKGGAAVPAGVALALAVADLVKVQWYLDTNATEQRDARDTLSAALEYHDKLIQRAQLSGTTMRAELQKAREIEQAGQIK